MGTYAECDIQIDYKVDADTNRIEKFKKEILNNDDIEGRFSENSVVESDLFISSNRIQNLEYQIEVIQRIVDKYKDIIEEISGTIMAAQDSFIYNTTLEVE